HQRFDERPIVVGEQNADSAAAGVLLAHLREASLAGQVVQALRQKVAVIGAALDLGAGRRGVDMGPSAIRYAGLDARLTEIGHECFDLGNVETAVAEATSPGDERARFLPQIREACERI